MDEPGGPSPQALATIDLRRGVRTRPSARTRVRPFLALLPGLALLAVGPSIETASAAICPIVLGQVYANGAAASCTIFPGALLTGVTTANHAEVTGNGVHILVPLLAAVSAASGSAVTFGPSSIFGPPTIGPAAGIGLTGLLAQGAGTEITASGIRITIGGVGDILAEALNGGHVTLNGGAILDILNSGGNEGLRAMGPGSQIFANDITVIAPLEFQDFAVHSSGFGAQVNLSGSTIDANTIGGYETAVLAERNSAVNADNVTINVIGPGANDVGVRATTGAAVTLEGGAVTVEGAGVRKRGLLADSSGSSISATGTAVTVSGAGGDIGARAANGGSVSLNGGSVSAPGAANGEIGLQAIGTGSALRATGLTVNIPSSSSAAGAQAVSGGAIALGSGTAVGMGGNFAIGLWASGAGSWIAGNGATIYTTGANSPGGFLQNGGSIALSGGSVQTSGPGSFGFLFQAPAGVTNALAISGVSVNSAADAFAVRGGSAAIAIADSTVIGNDGVLLSASGGATVAMVADPSTLTGAILTESGSATTVALRGGAVWNMTGNSVVTNLTNDGSSIVFSPPAGEPTLLASYKTLTATNYVGAGGTMAINTFLGGDGSPSDVLAINGGSATGNTMVRVTNTGGPGAETTGNGILVVDAVGGATTAPRSFALEGEARVGAFDYDLFRGGVSGSPNDWFLRSDFVVPPIPPGPPVPPFPPFPPFPPRPPPDPLPPGVYPIVGPELATYGVVQPLARQLGVAILGTLDDRVGDTYRPDTCGVAPAAPPSGLPTKKPGPALAPCPLFSPSVWGRFFGQTINNHYLAYADPRASGNLGGFQGGVDLLRGSLVAGHYERAGLYGAYGDASADVNGLVTNPAATAYILTHTGSLNLNAWSAGGYWTHVGPGGWYLDAVLQGSWYGGSASTQFARLDTNGTGFIASLEGGVPFALAQFGPGFVLEPQGQILWQKVSFRHDYDGLGDVALGDTTGPSGRIGLRTKWTIATAGGQVWQPYLRANVWRDWGAEADAVYSGTDIVPLVSQTTMLELGGGLTGRINANVSVFANVDYEFAVVSGDDKRNGVRGAFGARYTW